MDHGKRFLDIITSPFASEAGGDDPIQFYFQMRTKTCMFQAFEIMYRRLKPDVIKGQVQQHLYGRAGNELTKTLI